MKIIGRRITVATPVKIGAVYCLVISKADVIFLQNRDFYSAAARLI